MKMEFDFKEEKSRIFGDVLRPVAEVIFVNNKREILESVYVDSGADITLIPKSVGELLGFKIGKNDKIEEIKGIGEIGIPIVIKKLKLRIGEKTVNARVAWSLIEEVPLLLGRIDIFRLFDICFKKEEKTVFED